jgi:hypothetical protein
MGGKLILMCQPGGFEKIFDEAAQLRLDSQDRAELLIARTACEIWDGARGPSHFSDGLGVAAILGRLLLTNAFGLPVDEGGDRFPLSYANRRQLSTGAIGV